MLGYILTYLFPSSDQHYDKTRTPGNDSNVVIVLWKLQVFF